MISKFHNARKNEEGQALILASISMLILAMCVLATINIAYGAKEKIELQNAADATSYTAASYEARALNFLAYTNRAMIVQYVGQLNLMTVISYWQFNAAVISGLLTAIKMIFQNIPYIGWIIALIITIIIIVINVISLLLVLSIAILTPVIDAYNYGVSLAQAAVISPASLHSGRPPVNTLPWELSTVTGEGLDTFVKKTNPKYEVTSIASTMLNVDETVTGYKSRWGKDGSVVDVEQTLTPNYDTPQTTGQPAYDRLQMIEMVNAARSGEATHGETNFTTVLGLPRYWGGLGDCNANGQASGIIGFCLDKTARSEYGALSRGNSSNSFLNIIAPYLGGLTSATDEFFALDRFDIGFSVLNVPFGFHLDSWAYADRTTPWAIIPEALGILQAEPSHRVGFVADTYNACGSWFNPICWAEKAFASIINPVIQAVVTYLNQYLAQSMWAITNYIPFYSYGMVPYARFRPANTVAGPGTNLQAPSAPNLFNQPPVVLMVTAPKTSLNASNTPFLGGFGVNMGGYTSNGVPQDATYSASRAHAISERVGSNNGGAYVSFSPGDSLPNGWPAVTPGFHAVSAAMAYYHRPGDWREPPNLFNPMWGAKLMPVMDYPTLAQNSVLGPLVTGSTALMVH